MSHLLAPVIPLALGAAVSPLLFGLEMLALTAAQQAVGDWRLDGCTLYVTKEPCPMCAGAIVNARIERLVFGCTNPNAGAVQSLYTLLADPRL